MAGGRRTGPERITIFTDAQAAIRGMVSDEPGPGQQYTVKARKWVADIRAVRPDARVEIRWCPAHEEVAGNGQCGYHHDPAM